MLIGGHPEEVSLRPSANSMMFKQTNINLNLPLNNGKYPCLHHYFKNKIVKYKKYLI